ncbi:hypothetical protein ACFLXK_04830 [Chloroflexota bacterium]
MEMKVARLYAGSDGETHFEDIGISLEGQEDNRWVSELKKAGGVRFSESPAGYESGWHNSSPRLLVVTVAGEAEIEASDGTKRRFVPGDIMLCEDTTGRGHVVRIVSKQPSRTVSVALD